MQLTARFIHLGGLAVWLGATVVPLAADPLPRFPDGAVWNQDVSTADVHDDSTSMIGQLSSLGGFGLGRMQIDFSLHVVHASPGDPTRTIVAHPFGYYSPDCEPVGSTMPVPAGAAIEGQAGLDCDNTSEDCHLLVVQGDFLYEAYHVDGDDPGLAADELEAQCLAVWHLGTVYPPQGRGEHCTSADAAGFPMAPLLFNADEIAAALAIDPTGDTVDLGHAIRFILPNERMATDVSLGGDDGVLYVRPASHAGGPSGPSTTVPYGARLRLKSDFPVGDYDAIPGAKVILNTFMKYGIVLGDGGNVALTAESDLYTDTTWPELGIDSRVFDLTAGATDLDVTHFEVIDTGARIGETYDCVPEPFPAIFLDGFESGDTQLWSSAVP